MTGFPPTLAPLAILSFALATPLWPHGGVAAAGEFNPALSVGDPAPPWKELPGVDGKKHSLADLDESKPIVVVFTCNSCDVATDYEDRIIAFAERHRSEASIVAICVSTKPADALPQLRERAESKKFPFPYLHDESQSIGRSYGANYTPEFFLLSPGSAEERRILYMGSMDDSTYADRVKVAYLESALAAVLGGKEPAINETPPRGCRIRYPATRRRK